tara:strand:+ start:81528 stop:82418 length:891 start_codon:yes stop_codon:yes gene_type:complete
MNNQFFNTEGQIFMCAQRDVKNCSIAIFGVPYDGTTSFRPGCRFGPAAIREVSNGIETYCPQLNTDIQEINFADLGSLEIPFGSPEPVIQIVQKATETLLKKGIKPLIFGGEHSISSGAVKAIARKHSELLMVQLDAHADLRQTWLGSKFSHACAMRRCLDVLPSQKLFQVGIRSGTRKEFEELKRSKRLVIQKQEQSAKHLKEVLTPYLGKPIYLSIDLDWFDPSFLPGTGTPEPGGYSWNDFAEIIEVLKDHQIIAADIVELAPQLDSSSISSLLAAKVARSILILLNLSANKN